MTVHAIYQSPDGELALQQHRDGRGVLHVVVPIEVLEQLTTKAGWRRLPDQQDATPAALPPAAAPAATDAFVVTGADPRKQETDLGSHFPESDAEIQRTPRRRSKPKSEQPTP